MMNNILSPYISAFMWTERGFGIVSEDMKDLFGYESPVIVSFDKNFDEDRIAFLTRVRPDLDGNLYNKTKMLYLEKNSEAKDKEFFKGQNSIWKGEGIVQPDYYLAIKTGQGIPYSFDDAADLYEAIASKDLELMVMFNDNARNPVVMPRPMREKIRNMK